MKLISLLLSLSLACPVLAKQEPSLQQRKGKRPTFVAIYTSANLDHLNDEVENLNEVVQFAFDQYDIEHKTKTEVNLIGLDDKDDPQQTLVALKKIYADNNPVALVGPVYSNVALGLKDWVNEVKLPMVATFATHNDLTKNSSYVFRICASNKRLVKAMADYLVPEVQKHKLNLISFKDISDDYSTNLADAFRMNLAGVDIPYNEVLFRGIAGIDRLRDINSKVWSPTKKDVLFVPDRDLVAGHLVAAMETEPYLVAAIDTVNFVHLMKRIKSQKTHIRLVTTTQWIAQKSDYSKKIEEEYKKRFKHDMTITSALTYDAAYTVAAAYHRSLNKGIPLAAALRDQTKIEGVTGSILLGRDGERVFSNQFLKEEVIE